MAMPMTLEQYEKLMPTSTVEHEGRTMRFATPSTMTLWRVDSIRSKEPWTLEWIAGFAPGEILLDCGANVGMYTIWAAVTRGVSVYAFEPEAQNYALLNRNIQINRVASLVTAYCMGLSDKSGLSVLHMADMRVGGSCHSLGEALDYEHRPLEVKFAQGSIAATLDELVASGALPVAQHVKIDVDGFEPKVIAGARHTLRDAKVKSLLVETNRNLDDHRAMVAELEAMGFRYDPAQVARAERREGDFKGVAEYVFKR
jgi:FkbM family methyltransferase